MKHNKRIRKQRNNMPSWTHHLFSFWLLYYQVQGIAFNIFTQCYLRLKVKHSWGMLWKPVICISIKMTKQAEWIKYQSILEDGTLERFFIYMNWIVSEICLHLGIFYEKEIVNKHVTSWITWCASIYFL